MKRIIGKKSSMVPSVSFTLAEKKDAQDETLKYLEKIFSASSNIDAMKIFDAAKNGIESSTQTIKALGLTQKRYYTNLKRLIDAGLIEKVDGKYTHTTLGKIAYQLTEVFKKVLDQRDKLDLIDRVLKTKSLTMEETEEIMRAILKDMNVVPGGRITDMLSFVRMADTWEKVVDDVIEHINKAKKEIFFASRYYDVRTSEAILKAVQRGVDVYVLIDKEIDVPKAIRILLSFLLTGPKALNTLFNLLKSSKLKTKRYPDIPYSFIIIDGEYSMVEVVTPVKKTFSIAFLFYGKTVAKRLLDSFKRLWEMSSEVDLPGKITDVEESH